MQSAFVIMNPAAGNCNLAAVKTAVRQQVAPHLETELYETTGRENMRQVVTDALQRGHELVIAAGGDGTVSMAADGLTGTGVPLGILPVGTGNLVARELDIPFELEAACRLLVRQPATTQSIDGMKAGNRIFVSHVSMGTYAFIVQQTPPMAKQLMGRAAHVWAALKMMVLQPAWQFELTVDGRSSQHTASLIMLANVGAVGLPPLRWGPGISPSTREIKVCIVAARSAQAYWQLLQDALQGRQRQSDQIFYETAEEKVRVKTTAGLPVRGDGEIVGESEIAITVVPNAVSIIVPHAKPEGTVQQ